MKKETICVVGLGYVGLPLAVAFSEKFQVVGFDICPNRVKELSAQYDNTLEIDSKVLQAVKNNINYTTDIKTAENCDFYIITVPTPIDSNKRPDLRPLIDASKIVGSIINKENIIIYESTVYPGVTEDICVPILEQYSGLKFNEDFYAGYSPERINPGDKRHTVTTIVKVTSGSTPEIAQRVDELYKEIVTAGTYQVSSIRVAEASKVIENIQRDVNIALINELALIFDQIGIDTNEVIDAAATKWNFINLKPGLVGGHCISIDPYYLTFKAEQVGYKPDLILAARDINNGMSKYIADKTIKEMIKAGKVIKNSRVLILGVTFKEDCPDMRNSKVVDIIDELKGFAVKVDVYDPWVKNIGKNDWYKHGIISNPLDGGKKYDAIVVAVGHKVFKKYTQDNYKSLSNGVKIIIDVKAIVEDPTWRL
jgi:UDP-N-acetyl-D-galactosamine dehydrogenase